MANWALMLTIGLTLLALASWLCWLRLRVELMAHGSTAEGACGWELRGAARLGLLSVEFDRERGAGRLLRWRLLLWGRLVLSRTRRLESQAEAAPDAEKNKPRRRIRFEMPWLELVDWGLGWLGRIAFERLEGRLRLGLDDPAQTGALLGALWSLQGANLSGLELDLQPEFQRRLLEGELRLALSLRPMLLLGSALWFGLSRVPLRVQRPRPVAPLRVPGLFEADDDERPMPRAA